MIIDEGTLDTVFKCATCKEVTRWNLDEEGSPTHWDMADAHADDRAERGESVCVNLEGAARGRLTSAVRFLNEILEKGGEEARVKALLQEIQSGIQFALEEIDL